MASDLDPLFDAAAQQYGLDPNLLRAVSQVESGANVNAPNSNQGAVGLMQMLPATAAAMGISDPSDPKQAIPAAARYLAQGLAATGSLQGAVQYYHGGPDQKQWGPKTADYLRKVAATYQELGGASPNAPGAIGQALGEGATPTNDLQAALGYAPVEKAAPVADQGSGSLAADFLKRAGAAQPAGSQAGGDDQTSGSLASDFMQRAKAASTPSAPAAPAQASAQHDSQAGSFAGGLLNGIPIVGPSVLSGAEHVAAAANSVLNNTKFSDELANVQALQQQDAAAHPWAHTGGQLTGAVAGYAPLGATAFGARALGLAGPSMLGRMGLGAAGNALLGGADAAARGDSPISGALFGAAGGGVAPLAGQMIGRGIGALSQGVRGMLPTGIPGISRSAANIVNQMINADDPAAVNAFLQQHGDQAMLADAGPSVTGLTSALALKPSDAKTTVVNALTQRADGAPERVASQINDVMGPAQDPAIVSQNIRNARTAVNQAYPAIHAAAPPVDAQPVVDLIDQRLENATGAQRTALSRVRNELVAEPAQPAADGNPAVPEVLQDSSERLHNLRMDMDAVINHGAPGLGVEQGAVARSQNSLKAVRGAIDNVLKNQVPGMADADAQSALLANRLQAVEEGTGVVGGANVPNPTSFAQTVANSEPGQNIARNIGIRGKVDQMFGVGTQRSPVTLNKLLQGENGWGAQNLATAFGEEPASRLVQTLQREQAFGNTTNEVVQNSATARRLAANKLLEQSQPGSLDLSFRNPTGMALQVGKKIIVDPLMRMLTESPDAPRNLEIARMLTAQGATRDQIFAQLTRLNAQQNAVSGVGNALMSGGAAGANRLLLGASGTNRPGAGRAQ